MPLRRDPRSASARSSNASIFEPHHDRGGLSQQIRAAPQALDFFARALELGHEHREAAEFAFQRPDAAEMLGDVGAAAFKQGLEFDDLGREGFGAGAQTVAIADDRGKASSWRRTSLRSIRAAVRSWR